MARETWVQSQVESYQRLKNCYLMPPFLTLSIIRYGSRVNSSNPGKGVAPSLTPWCSSYRKGSPRVTLDYGRQLYFMQRDDRDKNKKKANAAEKNYKNRDEWKENIWFGLMAYQPLLVI